MLIFFKVNLKEAWDGQVSGRVLAYNAWVTSPALQKLKVNFLVFVMKWDILVF